MSHPPHIPDTSRHPEPKAMDPNSRHPEPQAKNLNSRHPEPKAKNSNSRHHEPQAKDLSVASAMPLDLILTSLATATASPDFESRLATGLEARLATPTLPTHRRWPWLAIPAAACALAVVLLSIHPVRHATPTHALTPASRLTASRETPDVTLRTPQTATLHARTPREENVAQHTASPDLAMLETLAPSHPAPPLPLTDGEREIRRFAQRHSAYEVAALDSRLEPLHERAERRDFNNFFAPPPEPSGNGPLVATALDRPNSFEPAPPPKPGPPLAEAQANPSSSQPTPGELLCCSAFVASATPQ